MRLKKSKIANKSAELDWDYQPPKINGGKETIDDMSLVVGMYGNYEVTKTGNLVGILEVSGINLDLLNETEQQDVFEDYGAFLMSTLGEGVDEAGQLAAVEQDLLRHRLLQQRPDHQLLALDPAEVGGQAVLGRQRYSSTPWLTERHGYDPTWSSRGVRQM
ncbi:hypothetical protein, partial [Salinifilum aidingensis]